MTVRRLGYTIGIGVLAVSGTYILVYLYRWEWLRAQFAAMLFLCIEMALIGAWLAEKVAGLQAAVRSSSGRTAGRPAPDPAVVARLREVRQEQRSQPFEWLTPRLDRTSVFVPVLLGAGVLLSGLAWLVERIAGRTAGPVLDTRLALSLSVFALPSSLLPGPEEHDWVLRPGPPP